MYAKSLSAEEQMRLFTSKNQVEIMQGAKLNRKLIHMQGAKVFRPSTTTCSSRGVPACVALDIWALLERGFKHTWTAPDHMRCATGAVLRGV